VEGLLLRGTTAEDILLVRAPTDGVDVLKIGATAEMGGFMRGAIDVGTISTSVVWAYNAQSIKLP